MAFVTYQFDSPAQFYLELSDILDGNEFYDSPITRVNRYLSLVARYKDDFLDESGQGLASCCYRLIDSRVFHENHETIIRSIMARSMQSTEESDQIIDFQVLLWAGKDCPKVYQWMLDSDIFFEKLKRRIIQLKGTRIQPLIIELMYEVCKLQRLERDKLETIDERLLNNLLDLVEDTTSDAEETLNCDAVKLVLALNEQFMLHMSSPMNNLQYNVEREFRGNLVLSVLAARQGHINVFSQSLIFMLNRAGLFEFFYTNDLHVLVDVVIRELWDLSEEESSLRHAYLRVLGPLLTNTQLKRASYKRAEIVRLLRDLGGGDLDSTLRRQLQEQQIRELFLEKERARTVKITFRERESSLSLGDRWGDRSGCASPVLSSAMGPKRSHRKSLLSGNSVSSNSLQVPGHEEQKEAYQQHFIQQSLDALLGNNDPGPLQLTTEPNKWCDQQRPASPTTQRLVERILQEWLDKEMKNGGGTAGVGLSVRGITDRVVGEEHNVHLGQAAI